MKRFIAMKIRSLLNESRIPFNLSIPSDILQIKDVFKKNNYKLYVVGGAIRDALLNKVPKDFDLVTDAVPDTVEAIMSDAGFKTLPTGKAFGVINVFTDQGEYEIATMRTDSNSGDGRRPDSVTFTDIETDAKRRDLTINALYYDIDTHEIIDFVGGVNDLKQGIIKTVGNPIERFKEDKLRILRAVRFSGRFGSALSPEIDATLRKNASLEGISGERIRDEFIKGIISSKDVKYFLSLLDRYNLFDWIFKGLNLNKDFINDKDPMIVIATLLKGNDPSILNKQLNSLKYPVDEIKKVVFLLNFLRLTPETAVILKKQQKNSGVTDEQIKKFGTQEGINANILNAFLKFKLTVNGEELMKKLNLSPGKELGDAITNTEFNNFKSLL